MTDPIVLRELAIIIDELREISHTLKRLIPGHAKSARLILFTEGDLNMPATIHVRGNGAQATFTEFDGPSGTGNVVPPVGPVIFSSSDSNIATVDATGKCTAVNAGSCTITGLDQGNGMTASDTLMVVAAAAQSATLVLQAL